MHLALGCSVVQAVLSHKRLVKEQIDTLRQLMYEMQCMGMTDGQHGSVRQ